MALSKNEANHIADLVNSMHVCNIMMDDPEYKSSRHLYTVRRAQATVTLADTYGIELPGLTTDRLFLIDASMDQKREFNTARKI